MGNFVFCSPRRRRGNGDGCCLSRGKVTDRYAVGQPLTDNKAQRLISHRAKTAINYRALLAHFPSVGEVEGLGELGGKLIEQHTHITLHHQTAHRPNYNRNAYHAPHAENKAKSIYGQGKTGCAVRLRRTLYKWND